jgi:hypothetical protein
MSSGERAPLCGYIIKPSFSIVNHHFYHIFYQSFIFYTYYTIAFLVIYYIGIRARSVLPQKKNPTTHIIKAPSLPPYPSHSFFFSIFRNFIPTKFPSSVDLTKKNLHPVCIPYCPRPYSCLVPLFPCPPTPCSVPLFLIGDFWEKFYPLSPHPRP